MDHHFLLVEQAQQAEFLCFVPYSTRAGQLHQEEPYWLVAFALKSKNALCACLNSTTTALHYTYT